MVFNVEALRKLMKRIKILLLVESGGLFVSICYSIFESNKGLSLYVTIFNVILEIMLLYYGIRYLTVSCSSIETLSLSKNNYHEKWLIILFFIPIVNMYFPMIMLKKLFYRYGIGEKEMKQFLPVVIAYEVLCLNSCISDFMRVSGNSFQPKLLALVTSSIGIVFNLILYRYIGLLFAKQEIKLNSICSE